MAAPFVPGILSGCVQATIQFDFIAWFGVGRQHYYRARQRHENQVLERSKRSLAKIDARRRGRRNKQLERADFSLPRLFGCAFPLRYKIREFLEQHHALDIAATLDRA